MLTKNRLALLTSTFLALCYGLTLSAPAFASDLVIDQKMSQLNFVSYKNEHIAESHSFEKFSGSLSEQGQLAVDVDLSSVNTLIPIRNERMKSMLFEVAKFSSASFSANIDKSVLEMKPGTTQNMSVKGELTIKNTSQPIEFHLAITALTDGHFQATTTKPSLINASDFGLDDGIAALQEVAMLNSISKTIPLSFSVVFK